LFKLNTGAPFVGFINPGPARLSAQKQGTNIAIGVQATPGARYLLQSSASLTNPSWTTLTNTVLVSSSFVFQQSLGLSNSAHYYRAVGVPP
jgi:hypothetical protein